MVPTRPAAPAPPLTENLSPEDAALLAQVEAGHEAALSALHRRYVNLVYSLTLRILGEPMAAEEVTQDVFLKLWRRPRAYDPAKGRFTSWLLTVARRAAIDRLRHDGRRPPPGLTANDEGSEAAHLQSVTAGHWHSERHRQLRLLLDELPMEQRDIIELAYFGGMSQRDLADHLNLPLGTVKTRMRLGLQKLRSLWQQNS